MTRLSLFLAIVAVLVPAAGCGSGAGAPARGPNVLLLVMDTTRADRLSHAGYSRETSPNLALLAGESTVYTNCWSPAGWTAPAHASIFTGLRPEHHGLLRGTRNFLLPESRTLAEILRDAGWRTACFTNNNTITPAFGLTQGFEEIVPLHAEKDLPYPSAVETHRRALEWATSRHRAGEPFFLFINDMEPHYPYTPPAENLSRFRPEGPIEEPLEWAAAMPHVALADHNTGVKPLPPERLADVSDLYDAEVRALDDAIGLLIEGFRDEGMLDETIVVITADHGENLGDHGLVDHMFSLHRTICHVPLLVRRPGEFEAGATVEDVVRLTDLMPTILEVAGQRVPEVLDGSSLLADTAGRIAKGIHDPPLDYLKWFADRSPPFDRARFEAGARYVFDGRHHLIRYSDGREELYDVIADPEERTNLAPAGGETLERLRALLPADGSAEEREPR